MMEIATVYKMSQKGVKCMMWGSERRNINVKTEDYLINCMPEYITYNTQKKSACFYKFFNDMGKST